MPIEFPDAIRGQICEALQSYCRDHFDQDLGVLQIELLYDFLIGLIGAAAYNRGVVDVQAYLQAKLIDLEIDVHQTVEFGK